ncbi:MAG TPA: efflux RND transporter periplasmic adaptor subunit [Cyclobacteriaceae bacterium]|nr:efflux RND transporter periplasmic adaptor subunit [Cyclobacteriaceae bacterium]
MYKRLLFLLLSSSLLLSACHSKKNEQVQARGPRGPVSADGFVVEIHSISDNIQVPGSLLPFEETQIRAEVSGRIVELNIKEGATVTKGTLLVKLFDRDLQAQLNKLKVQLKIKQKTAERNQELLAINGISQQDYDLSTLDVDNLNADIETTVIAISKTEIRAPYNGNVGLRNVSLGSYLSPTDIITTLREVDQLKLEFSVPEKYAKDIKKGYVVSFRVDGGKQDHKANVLATESSVDQNTRTLKVKAVVNEAHPELVPGIFAKVNLQLGKDNKALMIPTQAVIPQARGKQVILLRKDSASFVNVETGIRDSAFVQILNGLKVGDTVITTGLMAIRPNAKVKITKVNRLAK